METRIRTICSVALILATFLIAGCQMAVTTGPVTRDRPEPAACEPGKGPPDHAPAHGLRRKCAYNYYPEVQVYYSVESGVYFWQVEGEWTWGEELPTSITITNRDYVRVELETNRPYEKHDEVRRSHDDHPGKGNGPPGKNGNGPPEHAQNN